MTRFSNDPDGVPESLYSYSGALYPTPDGHVARSVIVSSERLTEEPSWREIPPNHFVVVRSGHEPEISALAIPGVAAHP